MARKLETATRKALTDAGTLETPLGQQALVLATMVANPDTPGTARVAAAKELRATLEEATRQPSTVADPVDEVKTRREERQRRARLAGA